MEALLTECSDKELLARIAAGDHHAFNAYYRKSFPAVYGLCRQVLKSASAADDVTQMIYKKIWKYRVKLGAVKVAKAYFKTMLQNAIIDYLVKEKNWAAIIEKGGEAAATQAEEADTGQEARLQMIEAAVNTLTGRAQQIFRMARLEGYSYRDIARALCITVSAVNHSLVNSMKKVRAYIQEKERKK